MVCASCGAENREGARFCDACGAVLTEALPAREVRKVVTVLFCDVTGSTALGERIDPESLRHVMARYFETARAIVERHGGAVEKFIGDAVMAVFGVPTVHEDDALRAVRAADELRRGLGKLNDELEAGYGTRLELRMGVNTGEVVTGTEERLATGDAVNVAARLEQAAQPGEVLLGEETYRLVREGIEAEAAAPVEAKGKAEPLSAWRLVSVQADAPGRRHDAPMIGRERQRELLEGAFANVASERSCHLFTILGAAGVGKSRLAQEFLAGVDATVVSGRCLSYGEGISYWPVTAVVKQLLPAGEATGPLASILGDDAASGSPEEIAWAFRKLLEAAAAERPVVVLFDDLHWGEPTFLDLVEHVADLSRDAPILLLCMARPELLDARAAWGGGKLNATNVLLEPLAPEETAELVAVLAADLEHGLRDRILEAAGGNPLFVEEMVAMAGESGQEEVTVPPTIQALLAARLDQLAVGERDVLERGAVEGQVFHRTALAALGDGRSADGELIALVRKDLVRPEKPLLPGDDAYRFRHLLIRDTAYEALPKATRADLHERFADWLTVHGEALVELDEMLGYHLEQAYRYRADLGPLDDRAAALAARAATRLLAGGDHALERGDVPAVVRLLSRALALLPADDHRAPAAQLELARAVAEQGDLDRAVVLLDEAVSAARKLGDERVLARSSVARIDFDLLRTPEWEMAHGLADAQAALAELDRIGDDGAVWALRVIGSLVGWLGDSREAQMYWRRAVERGGRADNRFVNDVVGWMLLGAWWGPDSAKEVLELADEALRTTSSKRLESYARIVRGAALAVQGALEEGRAEIASGRALMRELGDRMSWAGLSALEADMELSAGSAERAYHVLAEGAKVLEASSETGYLATVVSMQSVAALELGRADEALSLTASATRIAVKDDLDPRLRDRVVRSRVAARQGEFETAGELLREAGRLSESTDFASAQLDLALARAEVAGLVGRSDEQQAALAEALAIAEAKGHTVAAGRIRVQLEGV